jgi:hypothetical protein
MNSALEWARQQRESWLAQISYLECGHRLVFEVRDGIYGKHVNITGETIVDLKMRIASVDELIETTDDKTA